jgi:signal transduction histidine kinase
LHVLPRRPALDLERPPEPLELLGGLARLLSSAGDSVLGEALRRLELLGVRRAALYVWEDDCFTPIAGPAPGRITAASLDEGPREPGRLLVPLWSDARIVGALELVGAAPLEPALRDVLAGLFAGAVSRRGERDPGERRRFDEQLLQSGKLAALGELAGGVAHEINNPLFAILGLVEFLLEETEPGSKAESRLTMIQETGLELKAIVRALLDFAREPSDERQLISLQETAAQTIELLRRTSSVKSVEVVERLGSEPALVYASPNQVKQVVLNLVTNAHQAMPDGGTVTIDVALSGRRAELTVADTGPGIPEDVLPRVFDPFFTTKRALGGTGLGLAVSHGIAELHDGSLTVRSVPGSGAAFTLSLPTASEAA